MPRKRKGQPENYYKAFPTALRSLIEDRGITHQVLAEQLGKSRQAISYYCDGSSSPDWETLVKIAGFFSVSVDYLLGLAEEQTSDQAIQAVCRYTGLSASSAEYLHAHRASNKGFLTRLIDDILQISGIGSTVPDLVLRSAQALSLAAQASDFVETKCDIDNRIAYASHHKGCQYVISAQDAAEFYLMQAVEITRSEVENTITDMCKDAATFIANWQGDDGAEFFQWIKVDDSELPEDLSITAN